MVRKHLRIGTRGSKLARKQAEMVSDAIYALSDHSYSCEICPMDTAGDKSLESSLVAIGGKGLFLKEIEEALLRGEIDVAVHSMKDMPATSTSALVVPAILPRGDPRDVMVLRTQVEPHAGGEQRDKLPSLPSGARVGTSSARRRSLLLHSRADLEVIPLRGNVDRRIAKLQLEEHNLDAIVVALCGLQRLGMITMSCGDIAVDQEGQNGWSRELGLAALPTIELPGGSLPFAVLPVNRFIPAIAQGAIGIQCCETRADLLELLGRVNHIESYLTVAAERAFLKELGGDCSYPIAAYAAISDVGDTQTLTLNMMVGSNCGRHNLYERVSCELPNNISCTASCFSVAGLKRMEKSLSSSQALALKTILTVEDLGIRAVSLLKNRVSNSEGSSRLREAFAWLFHAR